MDTIGLLAAWVGVVSFLFATALVVATSPLKLPRKNRRGFAPAGSLAANPSNADVYRLVFLFGTMIRDLIFATTVVLVSIQILDLGPALLAAALPFNIDSKLITRATGLALFLMALLFVFRLCYLAVRMRHEVGTPAASNPLETPEFRSQDRSQPDHAVADPSPNPGISKR